jgi:hypothetical protein
MTAFSRRPSLRAAFYVGLLGAAIFVIALIIWQGFTARGRPDPTQPGTGSTVAFMDIGVLVFRDNLRLGGSVVLKGALLGLLLSGMVAVPTFVLQQHLPYRKMLITTGILLGVVLEVMVGEQAQEMQLAHWISRTDIGWLTNVIPAWMGMWFAVFPTYETMVAQLLAAFLVVGSYYAATHMQRRTRPDNSYSANATAASPSLSQVALNNQSLVFLFSKTVHLFSRGEGFRSLHFFERTD